MSYVGLPGAFQVLQGIPQLNTWSSCPEARGRIRPSRLIYVLYTFTGGWSSECLLYQRLLGLHGTATDASRKSGAR